jgi:hypothetical protein
VEDKRVGVIMLKKVVVPTLVISGAVFAAFLMLLATKGSEPVEIQVDNQQVFYGDLKDIVTPGVGAVFSLGVGVTGALVIAWGQSKRKTTELENRLSNLQSRITQQNSEIQALKLSPANPGLTQLRWFLDDSNSTFEDEDNTSSTTVKYEFDASDFISTAIDEKENFREQPSWRQMPTLEIAPILITGQGSEYRAKATRKKTVQTSTTMFANTQSIIGLAHQNANESTN